MYMYLYVCTIHTLIYVHTYNAFNLPIIYAALVSIFFFPSLSSFLLHMLHMLHMYIMYIRIYCTYITT